jgi:DNA-directed RNA polymerase alpha subunit
VLHEYTSIEGVQEDVVDILLNLKLVALRMHTRDSAELRLHKKGPGPVLAGDIQTDHDIEVVNPELVIANLTKAGELNMTLRVERGRGYRPAVQRAAFEEQTRPIGRLQLDASFSPVRRVTYSVDAARVEQRTDLDKLVIDIETNGTIDAEEAIRRAGSILKDQLSVFVDLQGEEEPRRRSPRCSSIRSCCVRSTSSSSPCARRTASRRRTSLHRRSRAADRSRAAAHAEPRQEVAHRDQGSAARATASCSACAWKAGRRRA